MARGCYPKRARLGSVRALSVVSKPRPVRPADCRRSPGIDGRGRGASDAIARGCGGRNEGCGGSDTFAAGGATAPSELCLEKRPCDADPILLSRVAGWPSEEDDCSLPASSESRDVDRERSYVAPPTELREPGRLSKPSEDPRLLLLESKSAPSALPCRPLGVRTRVPPPTEKGDVLQSQPRAGIRAGGSAAVQQCSSAAVQQCSSAVVHVSVGGSTVPVADDCW